MRYLVLLLTIILAACTVAPPGPPIKPSPVPPMPIPPNGAALGMYIPPADASGNRNTPNSMLSVDESIWHFRSAYNVAALNCLSPVHRVLADDYNMFIALHRARLMQANLAVDADFRTRYPGANGLRVRDTHMTDIYNYFALPPVTAGFCDLMLTKAKEANALSSEQLGAFSIETLAEIDDLFIEFYEAYERYQQQLRDWEALYGKIGRVRVEEGSAP